MYYVYGAVLIMMQHELLYRKYLKDSPGQKKVCGLWKGGVTDPFVKDEV